MSEKQKHYTTQLRIDKVLNERLLAAATEKGVSVAWLANQLLNDALDHLIPGPLTLTRRSNHD